MSTSVAPTSDTSGKGVLAKGEVIADTFRSEVRAALEKCTRPPKLVGILSTSSAPSRSYAQFTKKQCEELGVEFVLKTTGAAEAEGRSEGEGVEEAIIEANGDDSVDGIMVRGRLYLMLYRREISLSSVMISGLLSNFWRCAGLCLTRNVEYAC